MKKIAVVTLLCLSSLNYFFAQAQGSGEITVSGKVVSFEESLGLEGVSINVKGTSKSSGTQADGTYSISISPEDKILVFKLEGYQTEEVKISGQKEYDVVLKRNGNAGRQAAAQTNYATLIVPANTSRLHQVETK